jgi:hypothetical protein
MRIFALVIAGLSLAMAGLSWGDPSPTTAWILSFCGWLPHALPDEEVQHGH